MSSEVQIKSPSPPVEAEVVHDSEEYESAEEIDEDEQYEDEEEVEEVEEEEEIVEVEDDEEEEDEKKPDLDQDRKNPQFIPKRGYFYEHDDRIHGESEPNEPETPKREEKPVRKENVITDRWVHDLYDENDQAPKSHVELEERYGYDIRKDDMAPRARRKRVYGRGPNKYTRRWEEEEAYQRPRGGFRGRRGVSRGRDFRQQPPRRGSKGFDEEFPQLPDEPRKKTEDKINEKVIQTGIQTDNAAERPGRNRRGGGVQQRHGDEENHDDRDRNHGQIRGGRGRGGRRHEFANRNRYQRGNIPNNTSESYEMSNRPKGKEQRDWEKQVDEMRSPEKNYHHANGAGNRGYADKESKGFGSNTPSGKQSTGTIGKKSTLPFTTTEYTGSASLTANRNQEDGNANFESMSNLGRRENISVKVINAGPDQGNREVRISDKEDQQTGRSQGPLRMQQQHSLAQPIETAKPKRFSSQRPKSDAPPLVAGIAASVPISASPPLVPGQTTGSPQPQLVPASVITAYPASHTQAYYEQVPIPTNYEAASYEASGSPITVPISAHGPSGSPSLWTTGQHPAYSTSPYPSQPTGPPSVQTSYDAPAYISQPQPQIFAPPPHPHPQFISDPTIINYVPPGPPPPNFGAPFHPQGYQGYSGVAPNGPPPELYHGGVTYYSPQTQIQRPHMMVPTKRPKSVLQLVEPTKRDIRHHGGRQHHPGAPDEALMPDLFLHQYREESLPHVVDYNATSDVSALATTAIKPSTMEQQLIQKFEDSVTLKLKTERTRKSASPAPLELSESPSWADQMSDLTPLTSPAEHKKMDYKDVDKSLDSGKGEQ